MPYSGSHKLDKQKKRRVCLVSWLKKCRNKSFLITSRTLKGQASLLHASVSGFYDIEWFEVTISRDNSDNDRKRQDDALRNIKV